MTKRHLTLGRSGTGDAMMLHVSTWSDENHVGDLLDQADFAFRHIVGLRAMEASDGYFEPGRTVLTVYLPGDSAVWRAEVDSQFWDDFNDALRYIG